MNLYAILFEHFSQKDSEKGIKTYLLADSDENVYEWLKSNPKLKNGNGIYTNYYDNDEDETTFEMLDDEYNVIGKESFKEKMIRLKGNYNDEDAEIYDLYYGFTLIGWDIVKESITQEEINTLKSIGIDLEEFK